jgi:hypothetical protein
MADETQWPGTEEIQWPGTPERVDPIVAAGQMTEADRSVAGLSPSTRAIMHAFGERFSEDYSERLGLSDESKKFLAQHNVLPENIDDYKNPLKPFMAFNEGLILPLAAGIDAVWRSPVAIYHGLQAAGIEAGLPADVVSIPEAFMGSPHPFGPGRAVAEAERARSAGMSVEEYRQAVAAKPESPSYIPAAETVPPEAATPSAPAASSVIDAAFIKANYTDAQGFVELNKFSDDLAQQADAALKAGGTVVYTVEDKPIPIVAVDRGMLQDVQGQRWGTLALASPSPGKVTQIEITMPGGQPLTVATPTEIAQARDLGVIGPPRPSITELPPAEAAAKAAADPFDQRSQPPSLGENPWRDRFEGFVGKLNAPEDVQRLIRDSATENGDFMPARQGDIPLRHVDAIARGAGVEPSEIDARGLGRKLRNDAEVRTSMQLMLQVTENVKAAARDVRADGSPENLIGLQKAIMQRDLAVEQVVGLRAEWGRTGNVFQEFLRDVRDQQGLSDFLNKRGRSADDLREIANAVDSLDREGAAKVLNDIRGKQPGPIYWTWVNGLISGILTHTKYVFANAFYSGVERGVTTPIASMIGKAKQIAGVGSEADRVFFGEGVAGTWGLIAAAPTSLMTAARGLRAGMRVPLDSEVALRDAMIARGERVPATLERSVNPVTGQSRPIPGIWGRIIGAPGDAASAIHTVFKVMGERAGLEAEAYHGAASEGLNPADARFWSRRAEIAASPTVEMRQKAVDEAYRGTFMGELGPRGKAFQRFVKDIPGLRWLFPFTHIPLNLMKATYEYTPAAILDSNLRSALKGEQGGRAQDMAIARMTVGSVVMGWFANAALNDQVTGDMPRDPKERDSWKLQGKQPNSILIGDHWVSFARFGPAGDLANLGANIGSIIQYLQADDDDAMTKATWHAVEAAGHLIVDEVGFQSLANLFEAFHDPDRFGPRWVASTASSFIPFSSLLSQTASVMDPSMREAKTIIDGFKYRVPVLRETLLPKRDWSGQPIDNPQFGNIIRQRVVNRDPVDLEMDRLGLHAAPPQDRLGGVKLPPQLYDRYQVMAGELTRQVLERLVAQPNWYRTPEFVRAELFRRLIAMSRQQAGAVIMAANPRIIQQGVQQRIDQINRVKTPKLQDVLETQH